MNVMCIAIVVVTATILGMLGMTTQGAVITISILFGFFSGSCKSPCSVRSIESFTLLSLVVISLIGAMLASLSPHVLEIGYAHRLFDLVSNF